MAKHGNPLLQSQHGFRVSEETIIPRNGPDTSEQSIRVCWFSLEISSRAALVAAQSLIFNQVPSEKRASLQEKHNQAGTVYQEIRARGSRRWGHEDPAPGKWKQ